MTRRPLPVLPVAPELGALLLASRSAGDSVGSLGGVPGEMAVLGVGAGLIAAVRGACRSRAGALAFALGAFVVEARDIGWLAARNVTLTARSLRSGSLMP